jgi:hypothetical protein
VGKLGRDSRLNAINMHTFTRPTRRAFAFAFAFFCALALGACERGQRIEDITLAELAARQHTYDGRTVRTRGTVRGFDDPRHYWLEDENINRVGLIPVELIAPHLGRKVTVVGRYAFTPDRGRMITIQTVESFDDTR